MSGASCVKWPGAGRYLGVVGKCEAEHEGEVRVVLEGGYLVRLKQLVAFPHGMCVEAEEDGKGGEEDTSGR